MKASFQSFLVSAGSGEISGLHSDSGGMASDPPPLLLGADVGVLLRAELDRGVSLRRPPLQGEQVVTGTTENFKCG